MKFAIGIVLLLSATGIRADAAEPNSTAHLITTLAETKAPAEKRGLDFSVGPQGLDSLSFNGQPLLVSPESGELQPQKSVFRAVLDVLLPRSLSPSATPNKNTDTIDLSYPWGRISCAYRKQDDRLTMSIEVSNTSAKAVHEFSVPLMEMNFPRVPGGGPLEAGMFGFGFKGPEWPLDQCPPSYVHHKITATPAGARLVYPNAFSVLMAADGDRSEDHDALVTAVQRGEFSFLTAGITTMEQRKSKNSTKKRALFRTKQ